MAFIRGEGNEERRSVLDSETLRLETHYTPSLLRAGQLAGRMFNISQQQVRCLRQTVDITYFRHIASHGLSVTPSIDVMPPQSFRNFDRSFLQRRCRA